MTPTQKHRLFLLPSCFCYLLVFFNRMKKNKYIFSCERSIRSGTVGGVKGRSWTEETEPNSFQDGETISCDEDLQLKACRHIGFRTAAGLLAAQLYVFIGK